MGEREGEERQRDVSRRISGPRYGVVTMSRVTVHYVFLLAVLMAIVLPCLCDSHYGNSKSPLVSQVVTSFSQHETHAQTTSHQSYKKSNIDEMSELIGNFLTWTSSIYQSLSTLTPPVQGSALSMFREDFAKTEYGNTIYIYEILTSMYHSLVCICFS